MRWILVIGMMCWALGCGGSAASQSTSYGGRGGYEGLQESGVSHGYASGSAPGAAEESYDFQDDAVAGDSVRPDGEMLYAEAAAPRPPEAAPTSPSQQPVPTATATDAAPGGGPLLIYEAHLTLAVFKVTENLKSVATAGTDAGGFLSRQTDNAIVIRVPAVKFNAVIEAIEKLGDVLHRQVQATDVSEEFRDVEIRIRNALQVRDRLAELLTRATKVEESLQIERELERLTGELERLKGRMRFLQDRIAYSTITVSFQPKEQENLNNNLFRLPFDWLDRLGLQRLLQL